MLMVGWQECYPTQKPVPVVPIEVLFQNIWRSRTKGEPVYLGLPGTWTLKWRYDITPVGLRYSSAFGLGFNDSCNTDYVNFISIAGFWLHVGSGVFRCCILCTALGCSHLTWRLRQSWRSRLGSWRSRRWLVLTWSLPSWQMSCAPVLKRYHSESVCEQSCAEFTDCKLFYVCMCVEYDCILSGFINVKSSVAMLSSVLQLLI